MTGIKLITKERERQISKLKYSTEHDVQYANNELAIAGATYALVPILNRVMLKEDGTPHLWPWDNIFWKPSPDNRIKELAKAGALIAAEIDRLILIENNITNGH